MITDEALQQLFAEAADLYEPPPDAATRILDAAAPVASPASGWPRWRRRPAVLGAAAAVVLIATAAIASGISGGGSGSSTPASGVQRTSPIAGVGQLAPGQSSAGTEAGAGKVGGSASSTGSASAPGMAAMQPAAPQPAATPAQAQGSVTQGAPNQSAPLPVVGTGDSARVVKKGSADIAVDKGQVLASLTTLGMIAHKYGGYLLSSSTDTSGDSPLVAAQLRIPTANFERAVNDVQAIGTVESLSTQSTDVTAEYTDLGSRLKALKASLNSFETLLTRANTIGDVLAVQQQITGVQEQIDQTQGRINLLADQTTYGQLAVSVHAKGAPAIVVPVHHNKSGMRQALDDSADGFLGGVEFIIAGLGSALVFLLAVAGAFVIGRFAYGVVRRRLV